MLGWYELLFRWAVTVRRRQMILHGWKSKLLTQRRLKPRIDCVNSNSHCMPG